MDSNALSLQCTRQALSEKLGRGSRTVDLDLEPRLELLKDDRERYENVTKLAQTLTNQLAQFTVTQKTLGDAFSELSLKTPKLHVSLKKYFWWYCCTTITTTTTTIDCLSPSFKLQLANHSLAIITNAQHLKSLNVLAPSGYQSVFICSNVSLRR